MDILGTDNSRIATSVEEAKIANRTSGMRRALDRMHGFFFEAPDYVPEEPQASVTDIEEARAHHEAEVVNEAITTSLEPKPVPVAEGEVVDMAQHRRLKVAREKRDAAFIDPPQSEAVSVENSLEQQ